MNGSASAYRGIKDRVDSNSLKTMARVTGLEPATSGVTGRHSNRLSYTRAPTLTWIVLRRWAWD
jgi:hypothetical protein